MSRVLVTGAAGFIGAAVAKALLARGDEVLGIDNLNDYYDPALKQARLAELTGSGFTFHPYDFALDMPLANETFDRIIHLGAQAGVRYSLENPGAYVKANLIGHVNMLELARARQLPMVYASSSSVYGNSSKMPFSVEDRTDHPVSLYAATKKADELMSETYAHLYRIPLTGLRFFTVYGPWGRPDMAPWLFTKAILSGEPIRVFNHGKMQRDFTYIDDIVSGVLACNDKPPVDDGALKPGGGVAPHSIYNIGNNKPETLLRFIEVIEAACRREAVKDMQPMQPGDVPATYADIGAIARDYDYAPTTSLDVGIPKFVEWFRSYHGV